MNMFSNITLMYASLLLLSIGLIFVYILMFKKNMNKNGLIVSLAIFLVILGLFLLSCTKSITHAITINRIIYIGHVSLLFEMYVIINDFCNGEKYNFEYYCI